MKRLSVFILTFFLSLLQAQDKVYLVDGGLVNGKVVSVEPENIRVENADGMLNVDRSQVLLINYRNGLVEHYNKPVKSVAVVPGTAMKVREVPLSGSTEPLNFGSMNSLALVNADLSFSYERLVRRKNFGAGLLAAYNFNKYALIYNTHFFLLHNARKNYDAGFFVNIYPGRFQKKNTFYYGFMMKYTSLSFTGIYEDTIRTGGSTAINITYAPGSGSQLATMLTMGHHIAVTKNFFIRTQYALGAFRLKGAYRQQYNYIYIREQGAIGPQREVTLRGKIYFGIHAGFSF